MEIYTTIRLISISVVVQQTVSGPLGEIYVIEAASAVSSDCSPEDDDRVTLSLCDCCCVAGRRIKYDY